MSEMCTQLLEFCLSFARNYLGAGGPTSRLEEGLSQLGNKLGHATEVFATPTGVFISCKDTDNSPLMGLARIRDIKIHLGELSRLERLLEEVQVGKTPLAQAIHKLPPKPDNNLYPTWHFALAAFASGFVISFDAYQSWVAAWGSALITLFTWWITTPALKSFFPSSIFRDFLGALLALTAASAANLWMPNSIEAYSIGALVLLVPGLVITTAIAELAEQNLVSGTSKLMQGLLILLSLGLAYVLLHEIAHSLHWEGLLESSKQKPRLFSISLLAIVSSVYCYGVIFQTPPRYLFLASLTGVSAWLSLRFFQSSPIAIAAPLLASLVVGILSLTFGHFSKVPSQIFSVPGTLALLPGMLALSSFRYFALGMEEAGVALGVKVAVTAVSIVMGLLAARMPFLLWRSYKRSWSAVA